VSSVLRPQQHSIGYTGDGTEIELKRLEIQQAHVVQQSALPSKEFRLDQAIKLLPRFNEKSVKEYLIGFEKVAETNKWPIEQYASTLQAMLVGKGLRVFSELSIQDCKNYPTLKKALLTAYSVVSEVHRHRFRNCQKQASETYADFAFMLNIHFKRWMEGEEAYDDLEQMHDVLKLEQFMSRLPQDLHNWLIDRAPKTLSDAARLADEYTAVRKAQNEDNKWSSFPGKQSAFSQKPTSPQVKTDSVALDSGEVKPVSGQGNTSRPPFSFSRNKYSNTTCNYCHRRGHIGSQCFMKQRADARAAESASEPVQFVAAKTHKESSVDNCVNSVDIHKCSDIDPLFATHWFEAILTRPDGSQRNTKVLRDSGCLQSLLSRKCLTANTQRVCHVNLLKPYRRRDSSMFPKQSNVVPVCLTTCSHENDFGDTITAWQDVKRDSQTQPNLENLPEKQKGDVAALLESLESLCSHHINLIPGSKPVSSPPYRLHPEKAVLVEKEIGELLDMEIIKHSDSPWVSPIVLVPKADGSVRLCTDYRKS